MDGSGTTATGCVSVAIVAPPSSNSAVTVPLVAAHPYRVNEATCDVPAGNAKSFCRSEQLLLNPMLALSVDTLMA